MSLMLHIGVINKIIIIEIIVWPSYSFSKRYLLLLLSLFILSLSICRKGLVYLGPMLMTVMEKVTFRLTLTQT